MDIFEHIKRHSAWFIIPFTWIAYYMDFGVSHVSGDEGSQSFLFISEIVVFGVQTVGTMLMVAFALVLSYALLCYLATYFQDNLLFIIISIICLCFGMLGLFKEIDGIPLRDINLFWHLSSLSIGVWLVHVISVPALNEA